MIFFCTKHHKPLRMRFAGIHREFKRGDEVLIYESNRKHELFVCPHPKCDGYELGAVFDLRGNKLFNRRRKWVGPPDPSIGDQVKAHIVRGALELLFGK